MPLRAAQLARFSRPKAFAFEARLLKRVVPALVYEPPAEWKAGLLNAAAFLRLGGGGADDIFFDRWAVVDAMIANMAALGAGDISPPYDGSFGNAYVFRQHRPTKRSEELYLAIRDANDASTRKTAATGPFADLDQVVAAARRAFALEVPDGVDAYDAAVRADYDWIVGSKLPFVADAFHKRLLWQGEIPKAWRRVTQSWLGELKEIGLGDMAAEYTTLLDDRASGDVFISYSSRDAKFVDQLHRALSDHGIKCFLDRRNLRAGTSFEDDIVDAIGNYERVLLVLSKNSVKSSWVEFEYNLTVEKADPTRVLFPITIDDAVANDDGFGREIAEGINIADFRHWRNPEAFEAAVKGLVADLRSP